MKVTFILKDKSDAFYNGSEFSGVGLLQQSPMEQFARLEKNASDGLVSMRIGSCNAFRDRVELNQIRRNGKAPSFSLESRRGYKLATFIFSA
jgi:hypothetical protein